MLNTPILFLVFNRLDTTRQVLAAIRQAQPKQLFIAADGPRSTKVGEYEKCLEVRKTIDAGIDWPCEVHRLYREQNLGCGKAVYSAIDWFFAHVEQGIILEDDILPDATFFDFCQTMLIHYANNDEIMHISGANLQCGLKRGPASYYFSNICGIWGWATWKKSWQKYSYALHDDSNEQILETLKGTLSIDDDIKYYFDAMINVKNNSLDTWDYQWVYTLFRNKGISIVPQYNIAKNIGFSSQGAHTYDIPFWYRYLVNKPVKIIDFLEFIKINHKADKFYSDLTMGRRTLEVMYVKISYRLRSLYTKNNYNDCNVQY